MPAGAARHSARSQAPKSPTRPGPPGDEPVRSATAGDQGWALVQPGSRRRRLGAGKSSTNPIQAIVGPGTLASYRVAPTSAVGLGLPTTGQARPAGAGAGTPGPPRANCVGEGSHCARSGAHALRSRTVTERNVGPGASDFGAFASRQQPTSTVAQRMRHQRSIWCISLARTRAPPVVPSHTGPPAGGREREVAHSRRE